MRYLILLASLAVPAAAHAQTLRVDDDLFAGAQRLLTEATPATQAAALPGAMDVSRFIAEANRSNEHHEESSSSGILSGIGVGLQVGTPTALTFKFASGGNANIVLGVGAFLNDAGTYAVFGGLSLHGDYLFTLATLVNNGTIDLTAYAGPGLWLNLFNGYGGGYGFFHGVYYASGIGGFIGIAGRLPLGLNMRFGAAPIELYLELDPALFVFPGLDFFVGASLGFRWFF